MVIGSTRTINGRVVCIVSIVYSIMYAQYYVCILQVQVPNTVTNIESSIRTTTMKSRLILIYLYASAHLFQCTVPSL